jgi:sulfur-oxidizing protein SoxY
MISRTRRLLLKSSLAAGVVAVAAQAGLLLPSRLFAAWPAETFAVRDFEAAMKAVTGTADLPAGDIEIHAPEIAENGAMVAVTVETALPDVSEMALFVVENGQPLNSRYVIGPRAIPMFSVRVRMAESSDVVAAVKSSGAWYGASREVKVTLGGCGG